MIVGLENTASTFKNKFIVELGAMLPWKQPWASLSFDCMKRPHWVIDFYCLDLSKYTLWCWHEEIT